jgi:hypothetical protein
LAFPGGKFVVASILRCDTLVQYPGIGLNRGTIDGRVASKYLHINTF